ncbi:MAG: hypothetical protein DRP91_09460 [Candidatus Neomarinimicrobiota bacterium]|nr:MAG: hypothetical protein DRP91_09460 [Candidatus Neomarinimicrobiota bacterium]
MRENKNIGRGLYTQSIVKVLRFGPLSGKELKTECDELQISQSGSSFYRCLGGLKYLGFVQKTGERYELTSFGSELATRSGDAFLNYYSLGYIRCPECRRRGNLVKCEIGKIKEFRRSMGVSVKCPVCGYTRSPYFRNISKEEFMGLYNSNPLNKRWNPKTENG